MRHLSSRHILSGIIVSAVAFVLFSTVGCYQGRPSGKPPIHLNPNMDSQPKYQAQESSKFFADGSAMRQPVAGTVARGNLREDDKYYLGLNSKGKPLKKSPVATTPALLARGQERYNIYCSPCHGRVGDGKGIVVKRGLMPPPTFHEKRLREIEDGYIFTVISNGIRNMPSYKEQIPVSDRWAIVAYFRALQRSQNATIDDIPQQMRNDIR